MVDNRHRVSVGENLQAGPGSQQRVPTHGGTSLDRLQQEARRRTLVGRDKPPVRQDRRELIAHHTLHQRDKVPLPGKPSKGCQVRRDHRGVRSGVWPASVFDRSVSRRRYYHRSGFAMSDQAVTQPVPASSNGHVHVADLAGIRKTYFKPDGEVLVHALDGIDMSIAAGEFLAVMGASGSGKSTLMNILGCLDQPTGGSYLLDGHDVATMDDDQLSRVRREKIGFVFQAFNLISELNTVENVEVPLFYQGVPRTERADIRDPLRRSASHGRYHAPAPRRSHLRHHRPRPRRAARASRDPGRRAPARTPRCRRSDTGP